ncbi:MAG: hypothetical protein LAN37_10120 [Acidobacteriia bacterium]|nr:hypothetical protein [Terriglobia bacterium]
MSKRRGNPSWGKPDPIRAPVTRSDFEYMVKVLELSPEQYLDSTPLREWVLKNKDLKYVPPELLMAWGFTAKSEV